MGTGRGLTAIALAKEADTRITASDINPAGLEELQAKAKRAKLPISTQLFNAACALPKQWQNAFDMVVAKDVLPFLYPAELKPFFSNIANALKPGGWAIVTAPAQNSQLYEGSTPFTNPNGAFSRQLTDGDKEFIQTTVDSFNFETEEHLSEEAEEVGLTLTETELFGRASGWLWAILQKPVAQKPE